MFIQDKAPDGGQYPRISSIHHIKAEALMCNEFRLFFSIILFFVECALNVYSSLIVVQDLTAC